MKKLFALLLALAMVFTMVACSNDDAGKDDSKNDDKVENQTPDTGKEESKDPAPSTGDNKIETGEWTMVTSSSNSIHNIGTVDASKLQQPVLVTSFGQSTDASMLDTVMKKAGANYTYNASATAADVAGYKTVLIAVGASTKGLGAAGLSEADESARAKAFMDAVAAQEGTGVIMAHLGGVNRRGGLSDTLAQMVMEQADYIVVKEDGNSDAFFTLFAEKKSIPATLIYSTKDSITVFTDLFAAK